MRFVLRTAGASLAALLLLTGTLSAHATTTGELPEVKSTELTDSASLLALINSEIQLSTPDYNPSDLRAVAGTTHQLREEAADALEALLQDARQSGHRIQLLSAFRSYERQRVLFNGYESKYGTTYAERISARPGTSEHQLGLAADLGYGGGNCELRICFGDTPAGLWLKNHASDHGFIIRYPAGEEEVTGYSYEPWHLRYIGTAHAQAMREAQIPTFEEYYELLIEQVARTSSEPTQNAVETSPADDSAPWAPVNDASSETEQSDDLVVLRFLPPYRDWSFGISR